MALLLTAAPAQPVAAGFCPSGTTTIRAFPLIIGHEDVTTMVNTFPGSTPPPIACKPAGQLATAVPKFPGVMVVDDATTVTVRLTTGAAKYPSTSATKFVVLTST